MDQSKYKESFAKEHQGPLDAVVRYVSEAFSYVFQSTRSSVPWEGTATSFDGQISHHDDQHRHRHFEYGQRALAVVASVDEDAGDVSHQYIVDSIGRGFFGANVTEGGGEPKRFYSTGYTGKKYGSRRIKREVNRLSRY